MTDPDRHLHLDLDRRRRCGFGEVVFGGNKTVDECVAAARGLAEHDGQVLVTRASQAMLVALQEALPGGRAWPRAGCFGYGVPPAAGPTVGVISAGTSDAAVAEEAEAVLAMRGVACVTAFDCGVAGLHRLLGRLPAFDQCCVLIAVAGMDAALPTVLKGLVPQPVIAVPTSVGYGVATGGQAALHSLLASCAPGLTVVNIDNGFGAGYAAADQVLQARRLLGQAGGNPTAADG